MDFVRGLADPRHVATFQRVCGIVVAKENDWTTSKASNGDCALTKNNNRKDGVKNGLKHSAHDLKRLHKTAPGNHESPPEYRIENKLLYYIFQVAAILGNEEFYFAFYPFVWWNLDSVVSRQTLLVWAIVMYPGQATKDVLRLPRPTAPPAVHLEKQHLFEYATPSTHAMSATAMPITLLYLLYGRYQFSFLLGGVIAILWIILVCLSRLYLGVHSLLDILSGCVSAMIIVAVVLPFITEIDRIQQFHPYSPVVVSVLAILLCTVCYPSGHEALSKGDTVQIIAPLASATIASWVNLHYGFITAVEPEYPMAIIMPTLSGVGLIVLRFITGTVIFVTVKEVTKMLSIRLACYWLGLDRKKVDNSNITVLTFRKFVTFFCLGLVVVYVPFLHHRLGIGRDNIYNEVL